MLVFAIPRLAFGFQLVGFTELKWFPNQCCFSKLKQDLTELKWNPGQENQLPECGCRRFQCGFKTNLESEFWSWVLTELSWDWKKQALRVITASSVSGQSAYAGRTDRPQYGARVRWTPGRINRCSMVSTNSIPSHHLGTPGICSWTSRRAVPCAMGRRCVEISAARPSSAS